MQGVEIYGKKKMERVGFLQLFDGVQKKCDWFVRYIFARKYIWDLALVIIKTAKSWVDE